METNSKKIKKTENRQNKGKLQFPDRLRYFDDDYAIEKQVFLSDANFKKSLEPKIKLAKIYFEYKKNQEYNFLEGNDIFFKNNFIFELNDIFTQIDILIEVFKKFSRLVKENRKPKLINDFVILKNYIDAVLIHIKKTLESSSFKKEYLDCFHPFFKFLAEEKWGEIPALLKSQEYKAEVNKFIRTSNQERKNIVDFLRRMYIENDQIFLCRFDVFFYLDFMFIEPNKCTIDDFKKQINFYLERLNSYYKGYFQYALEIIFPSSIISGNVLGSPSPIGQVILVANKKIYLNKKKLNEFAAAEHKVEQLVLKPTTPFPKELAPPIDGSLGLTVAAFEAIDLLAEFLTIERRYLCPPLGSSGALGRAHCYRNLKIE